MHSIGIYYQILEIAPGASQEVIHHAFRKRAKELHPDMNPSPDAALSFHQLTEAYHFLLENYDDIQILLTSQSNIYTGARHQLQHASRQYHRHETPRPTHQKSFLDDRIGRSIFIGAHIFFIIIGAAMIAVPVLTLLLYSSEVNIFSGASSISMIGALGIGFAMIWKLSQAINQVLHRKK